MLATAAEPEYFFYRDVAYGSDAAFDPLTSWINAALDTLQVPESFDAENLGPRFDAVWENLRDPLAAIDREGGLRSFVHRQILPLESDDLRGSMELVPNYALHLFGGGMVYRKNAEWLRARGVRFPRTAAIALSMTAELAQEVVEKGSTPDDDEVADVYLFRPVGIALFACGRCARFAARRLGMLEWAYQPLYDSGGAGIRNAGQNFVLRPPLGEGRHRPFLYFGMAALAGASHPLGGDDRLSWGVGESVVRAERGSVELRPGAGVFWDRGGSLLASVIVNGTDALAVRINVYPGVAGRGRLSPGFYAGVADDGRVEFGLALRPLPLGVSRRF